MNARRHLGMHYNIFSVQRSRIPKCWPLYPDLLLLPSPGRSKATRRQNQQKQQQRLNHLIELERASDAQTPAAPARVMSPTSSSVPLQSPAAEFRAREMRVLPASIQGNQNPRFSPPKFSQCTFSGAPPSRRPPKKLRHPVRQTQTHIPTPSGRTRFRVP